uniref:Uncharacterized protein n=1 Tax=Arundo donax TaxID=35708 RepID=A0A0A9GG73_ARUDO
MNGGSGTGATFITATESMVSIH